MSLTVADISTWTAVANKDDKVTPEEKLADYDDRIDKKGIFANTEQNTNSPSTGVDEDMVGQKLRKWGDPLPKRTFVNDIPEKKEETPMSENVISPDGSIGIPDPNAIDQEVKEEVIVSFPDKAKVEALKMRFLKGEFNSKLNPDEKEVIYALIKIFDLDYPV